MFIVRSKGIVRTALEQWQYGIDQEEKDEYVGNIESSLLLMLVLLGSVEIIELITDLLHTYALKCL